MHAWVQELIGKLVPLMNNTRNSVRFYIDQDNDKAVIRAVPVKPAVASRATHRITMTEAVGEPITVMESKPAVQGSPLLPSRAARSATARVGRLVRRHSSKNS
jgi:hypothetical protein